MSKSEAKFTGEVMDTLEYLQKKFGLYMTVIELSEELKMKPRSIINKRSVGRFDLPMQRMGRSIVADVRDVAAFIDGRRGQ
jgi:hypothetical protein